MFVRSEIVISVEPKLLVNSQHPQSVVHHTALSPIHARLFTVTDKCHPSIRHGLPSAHGERRSLNNKKLSHHAACELIHDRFEIPTTSWRIPRCRVPAISVVFKVSVSLLFLISLAMTGCTSTVSTSSASILLFSGTGTSPNDVAAVEHILKSGHLDYAKANSRQLNSMSESELSAYHLLIVPGGHYIHMGKSLTPEATAKIRNAVHGGLNYLGICAGGLLAGDSDRTNSLNLTFGVKFGFYAEVNRNVHKAAVTITCADMSTLDQYWEDGPQFTGWGDVIGKYPDGTPAIAEGMVGQGWVILCGFHPEAPSNWRTGMKFNTPVEIDHAFAGTLVDAALHRKELPHFSPAAPPTTRLRIPQQPR